MDFRLRWLHRHLAIGLLLGLPMGLGGQLAIGLSDHETRPPLPILGLAVGIVASYVMVLMGIIGLFSTIFIHRRWGRITAVTLTSILLFLVVFAHLIGISVFVMAGDYPALASLQMIGDSPRQFFAHALQGTSLYIVAGIAMVALIDAIVCSALLKPDTWPLWQWLPLRACLVSLGLMVSTVTF